MITPLFTKYAILEEIKMIEDWARENFTLDDVIRMDNRREEIFNHEGLDHKLFRSRLSLYGLQSYHGCTILACYEILGDCME